MVESTAALPVVADKVLFVDGESRIRLCVICPNSTLYGGLNDTSCTANQSIPWYHKNCSGRDSSQWMNLSGKVHCSCNTFDLFQLTFYCCSGNNI